MEQAFHSPWKQEMEGGWEKKKRKSTDPGNLMLKMQGKLQTLQLLFAVQVACRREKSPFLACCPMATMRCPFCKQCIDVGGGNPLFCTSPTQRKDKCLLNTGNLGKLQSSLSFSSPRFFTALAPGRGNTHLVAEVDVSISGEQQ